MKKLIFLISMMVFAITGIFGRPIKWHASGTVDIGRPKKGCDGIWLCLKVDDWGVSHLSTNKGNPINSQHGIGVGVDGNLYLIINETLLLANQKEKIKLLRGQTRYYFDSEEIIPLDILKKLEYTGSNIIAPGNKEITFENGYYFIKLN